MKCVPQQRVGVHDLFTLCVPNYQSGSRCWKLDTFHQSWKSGTETGVAGATWQSWGCIHQHVGTGGLELLLPQWPCWFQTLNMVWKNTHIQLLNKQLHHYQACRQTNLHNNLLLRHRTPKRPTKGPAVSQNHQHPPHEPEMEMGVSKKGEQHICFPSIVWIF